MKDFQKKLFFKNYVCFLQFVISNQNHLPKSPTTTHYLKFLGFLPTMSQKYKIILFSGAYLKTTEIDHIKYFFYWDYNFFSSLIKFYFKFQCEGQLDWIEVPSSTRSYNVTLPSENVYQFAVAANTEKYSSGMVWATYTILHNKLE